MKYKSGVKYRKHKLPPDMLTTPVSFKQILTDTND